VDLAPEAILVADAGDHRVILANKNAEALFATSREDLIRNGFFRFFAPIQPDGRTAEESVARNRERVLAGEVTTVERAIRNGAGHDLLCEVRVSKFLLGGRETIRSSWTDITKRRRMEKKLQKSQARLEAALASIVDAVFISDEKGHFVHFNEAFATFHKFKNKEECAKSFAECQGVIDISYENGEPVPVDQWNVPRALRGETETNVVYRLRRKDTGETWIASYSFSPILGKKGRVVGAVVVGRDITESKEIEDKLRRSQRDLKAILDNMPSMIGYWDKDLRNRFANHAYFKWFGLNPDTMPGMSIKDVLGEELYRLNRPFIEGALAGKPQLFERAIHSPVGKRAIHSLVHYIPDVIDAEVHGFYALITDITSVKHAEAVMAASLKEKEVLLKEIHHRVKNNLQIISSLLSLQADGSHDPIIQDVLTESRGRVASMALIHEQLYRSHDLAEIDVDEYLGQLLPRLVSAYRGVRNISLELELSAFTLTLDQSIPFGLIVNELVTNALKHGFKGRARGTVNVAASLAGGRVTMVVTDDGGGLPDGFNAQTVETLGLQIVNMLSQQLRGEMTVDTARGTAFTLTFPHRVRSDP
jgi:PAS domain S-box-containing protein